MKNFLLLLIFLVSAPFYAQVGIGTTTPDASAMLDVQSTSSGFAMPRMAKADREAIANPIEGLQVYDTDYKNIWIYTDGDWRTVNPVAYGYIDSNGNPIRIKGATVQKESTGKYLVTLNTAMPANDYIVSVSVKNRVTNPRIITFKIIDAQSFYVYVRRYDDASLRNRDFSFSINY